MKTNRQTTPAPGRPWVPSPARAAVLLSAVLAFAPSAWAATLKLRLDASALTAADNDPIASWANTESGGGTFSQGDTAKQPLFKTSALTSGKKGVVFDGSNDTMLNNTDPGISSLLTGSTTPVLYLVYTANYASASAFTVITDDPGKDGWQCYGDSTYLSLFRGSRAQGPAIPSGQSSGSHLWSIGGNSSGANTLNVDTAATIYWSGWNGAGFAIGTNWQLSDSGHLFNGAIHEVLVFDAALSADEKAGMDFLMDQKWGLGLGFTATSAQIAAASTLLGISPPVDPPVAVTQAATGVSAVGFGLFSATLNGTIDPGSGPAAAASFRWGLTAGYGNTVTATPASVTSGVTAVSAVISGLAANTTYHFRVAGNNGSEGLGAEVSFTTPAQITTEDATPITYNGATLNGTVDPNGVATTAWFEWGTGTSYGTETAHHSAGSGYATFSASITGLEPNATYHFRAVANNGTDTVQGPDRVFTTPVQITTEAATDVASTTATLNGTVDPDGHATTAWFEWGADTSYGTSTSPVSNVGSSSGFAAFSAPLSGLTSGSTYHYRAVATVGAATLYGPDMTLHITGLKLRLDASLLTGTDGDPISAWTNTETDYGGTFSQGNADYQPTFMNSYSLNPTKRGVVFDGNDTLGAGNLSGLLNPGGTPVTSAMLYAVVTVDNCNSYNILTDGAYFDPWWVYGGFGGSRSFLANFRTHRDGGTEGGIGTLVPNQATGSHLWRVIGQAAYNTTYLDAATQWNWQGWNGASFTVAGANWQLGTNGFKGAIHEILVFDAALSADERIGMDYLMDRKWALGLGLSATYAQIAAASALLGVAPPADPFASWMSTNYPTLTGADALPGADPDGDGLTNWEEFAFGLDPTSGASVNPISVPLDKTTGTFSYTRTAGSTLTYTVWTATDLQTWDGPAAASQTPRVPVVDGVETVDVQLTGYSPPVGGTLFVRVKAQ
ncbi:MAG: hypothetical protein NTW21_16715 [Verrucomicrobia bacterium]|nr:hypothetical protein [Verrucomicrobiota bacterium]